MVCSLVLDAVCLVLLTQGSREGKAPQRSQSSSTRAGAAEPQREAPTLGLSTKQRLSLQPEQ